MAEWWSRMPGREKHKDKEKDFTLGDWTHQYVMNEVMKNLDPYTQREVAQWLARDNPDIFANYADVQPDPGDVVSWGKDNARGESADDYLNPDNIGKIIDQVSWDNLIAGMDSDPKSKSLGHELRGNQLEWPRDKGHDPENIKDKNRKEILDTKSSLRWMSEALKAAQGGVGDDATRSDQLMAAKRLDTLFREADQEPQRGGRYKTLVENILNPVVKKGKLSGMFGSNRAVRPPKGKYQRGGFAFKNPTAT